MGRCNAVELLHTLLVSNFLDQVRVSFEDYVVGGVLAAAENNYLMR